MAKLWTLTRLELYSLAGLNRYRHTADPREKNRWRLLCGTLAVLLALAVSYVGILAFGLCSLGMARAVPAWLVTLSSLLNLVFGLFGAGQQIFSSRGYDLLGAMPIGTGDLVLSRFLGLYIRDLMLSLAVMVPGLGVYAWLQGPGVGFYAMALAVTVLLPAIPLSLSVIFGTLLLALTARLKHRSLVQTILSVALVLGVLMGSFQMGALEETLTPEMLAGLAADVGDALARIWPPAKWAGDALAQGQLLPLVVYAVVSLGVLAGFVAMVSRLFRPIMGGLWAHAAAHNYSLGRQSHGGLAGALYLREVRRYFSSSTYVVNTILGPILGAAAAGALCFGGMEAMEAALPLDIRPLIPFGVGMIMSMMSTTSCSISMEGRQLWIIRSLPVPTGAWLDAKLLLNLSLMAPCYAVAEVFLLLALKPGLWQGLMVLLIPAVQMLFAAVFGLWVNLRLPRFDWEKEEQVVKQGASATLGGFGGMLPGLLGAGLLLLPRGAVLPWQLAFCLILVGLTLLLYRNNHRFPTERL